MHLKNFRYIAGLLISLAAFYSCEDEPIDWEAEDAPSKLVVEATFTNEYKHHKIILTQSADYFSNEKTPGISNAVVTISTKDSIYKFREEPNSSGIYKSENKIAGHAGKSYRLDIQLEQPLNGETGFHATEKLYKGIRLDSIQSRLYENPFYVEGSPMDSIMLVVNAFGAEPKELKNYYRVDLYKNSEMITDTVDEVQIYSDQQEFSSNYLHNLAFFENFDAKDTLTLGISSVSEKYRYFITGIQNIANQSGNPFDMSGPPANAIGNIQGGDALGYFRVSYVSSASAVTVDMREEERKGADKPGKFPESSAP